MRRRDMGWLIACGAVVLVALPLWLPVPSSQGASAALRVDGARMTLLARE